MPTKNRKLQIAKARTRRRDKRERKRQDNNSELAFTPETKADNKESHFFDNFITLIGSITALTGLSKMIEALSSIRNPNLSYQEKSEQNKLFANGTNIALLGAGALLMYDYIKHANKPILFSHQNQTQNQNTDCYLKETLDSKVQQRPRF